VPQQRRRATDHPPFTDMVTRGSLDDRLETVLVLLADLDKLEMERWESHRAVHEAVAESLRDYKRDANEWRATLADLRGTFIPKAEFQSEHRALDSKFHGEMQALHAKIDTLDQRLDTAQGEIKDTRTEQLARRSVFSDTRSIIAGLAAVAGLVVTFLLIFDRVR
jgi:gamma-glutamyl:cysteine ligase YbdK (ATP-grasp superfamily)